MASRLIFTEDESIILTDKSGNEIKLDTEGGNINITAPSSINITAGKSVNINAGEDISISAGMNINTSATMNYTQMVGINYISTIAGNASHFITGKLMEMIDGDVHSETKQGKTITNSELGIETLSQGKIHKDAQGNIDHRSGEIGKSH